MTCRFFCHSALLCIHHLSLLGLVFLMLGCKSMGGQGAYQSSSKLMGVYDDQYLLRLAKVQGTEYYRFETCKLVTSENNTPYPCVSAFKTNFGEDLVLSLNIIDKMSFTDNQSDALKMMHKKFQDYRSSLVDLQRNIQPTQGMLGGGIILGGVGGGFNIGFSESALEKRAVKLEETAKDIRLSRSRLKEVLKQDPMGFLQSELGQASLDEVQQAVKKEMDFLDDLDQLISWKRNIKNFQNISNWKVSEMLFVEQITPDELFSKVKDYVKKYFWIEGSEFPRNRPAKHKVFSSEFMAYQPEQADELVRLNSWVSEGNSLDRAIHSLFESKFNTYYRLETGESFSESLSLKKHSKLGHKKLNQLRSTLRSFVLNHGVPSRVGRRIQWLKNNYVRVPITPSPEVVSRMKANHADLIHKAKEDLAEAVYAVRRAKPSYDKALIALLPNKKLLAGIGMIGVGLLSITRLLAQPLEPEQESRPPADDHMGSFQVLIDNSTSLMSTSSGDNNPVPSVKDILLLFATWQDSIWVDTEATGILISQICLPSLSTGSVRGESDCEPVPLPSS